MSNQIIKLQCFHRQGVISKHDGEPCEVVLYRDYDDHNLYSVSVGSMVIGSITKRSSGEITFRSMDMSGMFKTDVSLSNIIEMAKTRLR